jgi:hypothetical protein
MQHFIQNVAFFIMRQGHRSIQQHGTDNKMAAIPKRVWLPLDIMLF